MRSLVAICGVMLLAPALAAADGLAWDAPSGCPSQDDVVERVHHRLDGEEVGEVSVVVRHGRNGFTASIDTRAVSVAGQGRELSAARCDALADAVAVVVARLATEARREREARRDDVHQDDARRDEARRVATADADEPAAQVVRLAPTNPRPLWNAGVRLLGLSGIGITPKVGYGGELAAYLHRRETYGEIGYARWAERPAYLVPGAPGRVDVGVSLLALRGGWASDHMPLRGWLGLELGSMHGVGAGLIDPRSDSGRWAAFAAGFGVGWPTSKHTRVVGTFEVAAPVSRARFVLTNGTEIYEPSPASARCALGFEVAWR